MSAIRDELHFLVDQLPEERLAAVLRLIRGDAAAGRRERALAALACCLWLSELGGVVGELVVGQDAGGGPAVFLAGPLVVWAVEAWLAGCAQQLGLATFMRAVGISCSQRLGDLVAGLEPAGEEQAVRLLGGAAWR